MLVLAAGEPWESPALVDLEAHPGLVVLKRCVDVDDLLASVTSGQADVAVLALDAPGLDPAAVAHLRRHAVRPVAVTTRRADDLDVREQAHQLGITAVVGSGDLATLPEVASAVDEPETRVRAAEVGAEVGAVPAGPEPEDGGEGRLVAVWGPAGAPGRILPGLRTLPGSRAALRLRIRSRATGSA